MTVLNLVLPRRGPLLGSLRNGELVMPQHLFLSGMDWVADHFIMLRHEEEDSTAGGPTIEWVLAKATEAVRRWERRAQCAPC